MSANPATNAATSLIQLDDLKKVFYADEVETHALSGVHFEIGKGDYLSIAGPSGCGKSTCCRFSAARYAERRPVRAERHAGRKPHARSARTIRNKEIGFIFQAFNLIGDLTVFENVELPLTYRDMYSDEREARARSARARADGSTA